MATVDLFEYSRVWTDPADFPSIDYQKNWNSSDDFPTIETDETQVRSDMQALYDEIADYINGTANAPDSDQRWLNKGLRQYVVATGTAEETRIAQEEQRQKNEYGYTDDQEVFHNGRVQNETERQTAETARDEAENGYTDAEEVFHNGRVQNEAARVQAENERVAAEAARADENTGIVAQATAQATLAKSYTVGGTSSRTGEDTDNAKYYSEQAADSATTASTKAGEASGSATTASTKAGEAAGSATTASTKAGEAAGSATTATAKATLAESWAVGGTGTRSGENTNNAKYWSDQAQAAAGGGVSSFNGRTGAVTPQSGDYDASMVGALAEPTNAATGTVGQYVRKTASGTEYADDDHVTLTLAEYNALVAAGTVDPDTIYLITDDTVEPSASDVPEMHANIFRGHYLGTSVTADQYDAIDSGAFGDLYVGDYWTIDGVNWRIADIDYWLGKGDTECTTHHLVIVPDAVLYNAQMNSTRTVSGAYIGSAMYTTNLATAKSTIGTAFGSSHVLNHRERLANAVTDSAASSWSWYDSTVEIMSEVEAYGSSIWSTSPRYEVGIDHTQFALFRIAPKYICNRSHWWLRCVAKNSEFAYVNSNGYASSDYPDENTGVRPAFGLCKANPS